MPARRTVLFLFTLLALLTCLLPAGAPPASAATGCTLTPETFAATLPKLAGPGRVGWVASDGFATARLNDHQVLFINQDTFWGTSDGAQMMTSGTMRRNSIMIYDDRNPSCLSAQAGVDDGGFFPTGDVPSQHWFWPGQPQVSGSTVVMPLVHFVSNGTGSFGFVNVGAGVGTYRYNGSTLTLQSYRRLTPTGAEPPGAQFEWAGSIVIGDYVYLGLSHLRAGQFGHDLFMARVPASVWFNANSGPVGPQLQYLTKTGWQAGATYPMLRSIISGEGDAAVSFTVTGDQFHIIVKQYSMLGDMIVDYHAATPDGNYEETPVARAPTKPNTWSYWALVHPELGSSGLSRYATLNFNNSQDLGLGNVRVMDRYRPTMFNLVLAQTVKVHTGVPSATVFGNLTVTGANLAGYTTAYPCDVPRPLASNVNFTGPDPVANALVARTDANGDFCVSSSVGTHVVFDKTGSTSAVSAHAPERLVDTRTGRPVASGSVLRIHTQAPAGSTVFGNLTATAASGAGHTTVWSCDGAKPLASTNNYVPGRATANMVAVQVDASGDFCVAASATTHLVFDKVADTGKVAVTSPTRLTDTRTGAPLAAGQVLRIKTGVQSTVLGNLTVVSPARAGYATVWPCDTPRPVSSTLNFPAGQTRSNMVIASTNPAGELCVAATASTHIVFDRYSSPVAGLGVQVSLTDAAPTRLLDTRKSL